MRRALSILLVLLFSVGPLSFALRANDDASLPACCRRHGAHHCAMAAVEQGLLATGTDVLRAPSHCPQFPQHANARTTSYAAVMKDLHAPQAMAYRARHCGHPSTGRNSSHFRIPDLRGPPALNLI